MLLVLILALTGEVALADRRRSGEETFVDRRRSSAPSFIGLDFRFVDVPRLGDGEVAWVEATVLPEVALLIASSPTDLSN